MVEPSWWSRATRLLVAAGAGCSGLAGCSYVPKARLDDCHRLSQTLQAENSRLKDTTISLRSQTEDLNQRAVDEARRLRAQEEEIQRLVQSVAAYQDERDQLAAAFERIKAQVRMSAGTATSGLKGRFEALARSHPGWEFDPERDVLTIPAAQLFEAGSDRPRPEARAWLRETLPLWGDPEARDLDLLVVGRNASSAVRRAGLQGPEEQGRTLGRDRAAQVRDLLANEARLDPARIEVAGFEVPPAGDVVPDEESQARNRRIEIHLRRRPAGPAAPPDPATGHDGGSKRPLTSD
jgi:chemotaxis protein MotB